MRPQPGEAFEGEAIAASGEVPAWGDKTNVEGHWGHLQKVPGRQDVLNV